jgi:hypothetical protein
LSTFDRCLLTTAPCIPIYHSWFGFDSYVIPGYVRSNKKDKLPSTKDSGDVPYLLDVGSVNLFYMPNNDEFKGKYSRMTNTPYVFMQPPCDMSEGHDIIGAILQHRIATLKGRTAKELPVEKFCNLLIHRDTWIWPRTSDRSHPAYSLPTEAKYKTHAILWECFIGLSKDGNPAPSRERLPVFKEMMEKTAEGDDANEIFVPRIARPTPILDFQNLSHGEKTWREILLGVECGQWMQAIESKRANVAFTAHL